MQKSKKLFTAIFSCLIAGLCLVLPVQAERIPKGSVYVTAEALTIGLGYISEPAKIPFYEGDTGVDIIERYLGKENINNGKGVGVYISSISANTSGANVLQPVRHAIEQDGDTVTNVAVNGEISGMDFSSTSGWMIALNNEPAMVGLGDYSPVNGDVLRLEFSAYSYGSDLGYDNSSWGGPAPLFMRTDKDALIKAYVDRMSSNLFPVVNGKSLQQSTLAILVNPIATQDEIDAQLALLHSTPAENDGTDAENRSPNTGVNGFSALFGLCLISTGVLLINKPKKI